MDVPRVRDPVQHFLRQLPGNNISAVFKVFSSAPHDHILELLHHQNVCPGELHCCFCCPLDIMLCPHMCLRAWRARNCVAGGSVVLERPNITARYCSLVAAVKTGDWTGHLSTKHGRTHPPCTQAVVASSSLASAGGAKDLVAFRRQQFSWFKRITRMLHHEGLPFLMITFPMLVADRTRALDAISSFCGLGTLRADGQRRTQRQGHIHMQAPARGRLSIKG